jgi:cytoskeletal protein RodZ
MSDVNLRARELFSEIGLKLRAAREAQGMTLGDIATRTRIHLTILQKIEAGEMEGLPAFAFVRGFIRNIMQTLELEDPQLLEELQALADQLNGRTRREEQAAHLERQQTSAMPWLRIGVAAVAVVLILWIAYLVFRTSDITEPTTLAEQTAPAQETAQPPPAAAATATPNTPRAEPPAVTDVRQLLRLTVRGLDSTWIRLSVDRAQPVDVLVEPAETLEWEANEEFRLTIGKSDGVAVYLNGEDILLPKSQDRLIPGIVLNKLTLLKLEN